MIEPAIILDSREQWRPCAVETIYVVGAQIDGHPADLAQLPAGGGKLDFPRDMTQPECPFMGYRRLCEGGSLWWVQYWLFYLYNPKVYAGFGAHEGDWEMVQFGCRDPERNVPILATYSQHDGGERREFWRTELSDGKPKVYVARDSHANYFGPHRDVTDQADGRMGEVPMTWQEFGGWESWPGKWGNSENSPGPLTTRRAWTAPHAYHSQARG